jgi:hypothetical protein
MPVIGLYTPEGLFPKGFERNLASQRNEALLEAEGAPLATPLFRKHGGVYSCASRVGCSHGGN